MQIVYRLKVHFYCSKLTSLELAFPSTNINKLSLPVSALRVVTQYEYTHGDWLF